MDGKLAQISSLPAKDRLPEYQTLVAEVLSRPDSPSIVRDIHALVDAVQENVVNGRQILSTLSERLSESKSIAADVKRQIVEDVLTTVQARVVSYEEQVGDRIYYIWVHRPHATFRSMLLDLFWLIS